jgi:hypothetical protein
LLKKSKRGERVESLTYDEQEMEQLKMEWDMIGWMRVKGSSSSCDVDQLEKYSDKIRLMTYEGGGEYSILGAQ